MDDLATWLRAQLDHHAEVHLKTVRADALADLRRATPMRTPDGNWTDHGPDINEWVKRERRDDPDGFWALWDAHRTVLDAYERAAEWYRTEPHPQEGERARWTATGLATAVRCVGLAYQRADGYRDEWRPQ